MSNQDWRDKNGVKKPPPPPKTRIGKRHSAYALVWWGELGKILLVKEEGSQFWGLPGGELQSDESHEKAVIRETLEETGFSIVITHERKQPIWKQSGCLFSEKRGYVRTDIRIFSGKKGSGFQEIRPIQPDLMVPHTRHVVRWVSIRHLVAMVENDTLHPLFHNFIRHEFMEEEIGQVTDIERSVALA